MIMQPGQLSSYEHRALAATLLHMIEDLAEGADQADLEHLAYRVTKATNHVLYVLSRSSQQHRPQAEQAGGRIERELRQHIGPYAA